jgi:hypothetical protein
MRRTPSLTGRERNRENEAGRQINLLIPASRHKAFKRYAVEHDTSMSQLLNEWIGEHVAEDRKNHGKAES